jgi:putative transposase
MRFAFIDTWKKIWSIEFLCRVLQVSSRGFRAWKTRPISQTQRDDMVLLAHIREQHRLSLQSYGRPRMTEELQALGLNVGHRRVGRLMRENGIKVVRTRKHKVTTDSNHRFNIAPNLLDQDFSATGPNQKWAGDISYIWTNEGWLYLAVVIDLYSRRVIGWAPLVLQITWLSCDCGATARHVIYDGQWRGSDRSPLGHSGPSLSMVAPVFSNGLNGYMGFGPA